MAKTDKDLLQCPSCHSFVGPNDLICGDCHAVLPKGQAARDARGGRMDRDRAEALAAYERQKLEFSHVPRWLRRLSAALDHANDNPSVHRLVQWGSGLIGFGLAFELADPFIRMLPLPEAIAANAYLPLQLLAGFVAFWVTSYFIFSIFTNIVAAMRQVFGEEQDARILQGTTSEKAARLNKERE